MKPSEISQVLNMARKARSLGKTFTPCFVSPPGLGKSEIIQQWAREEGYSLIDIRTATREAPDMIGFPRITLAADGKERTTNITPDFWPDELNGKVLVFLDEVNRGNQSVLNTLMQLLTDRKMGTHYSLPEETLIVAAINPEDEQNDVNTMDSALKDRLEFFNVEYNKKDHVLYMKATNYDPSLIAFVESNTWTYRRPESVVGAGAKYISPRTFSKMNTALLSGALEGNDVFETMIYTNVFGQLTGMSYYQFRHNERPVTFKELSNKKTRKDALERIKKFSDPKDYKAGIISLTCQDIVNDCTIEDELLVEVLLNMPADQGPNLIHDLEVKRGDNKDKKNLLLDRILKNFPQVKEYFTSRLA